MSLQQNRKHSTAPKQQAKEPDFEEVIDIEDAYYELSKGNDKLLTLDLVDFGRNLNNQDRYTAFRKLTAAYVLATFGFQQGIITFLTGTDHRPIKKIMELQLMVKTVIKRAKMHEEDRLHTLYKDGVIDASELAKLNNNRSTYRNLGSLLNEKTAWYYTQMTLIYMQLHRGDYTKKIDVYAMLLAWSIVLTKLNLSRSTAHYHDAEKAFDNYRFDMIMTDCDHIIEINDFHTVCMNLLDPGLKEDKKGEPDDRTEVFYSHNLKCFVTSNLHRGHNTNMFSHLKLKSIPEIDAILSERERIRELPAE